MKISAIILAKNEEQVIADCIDSVSFCDQIIVVNNNSTDRTLEIAKRTKAEVITCDDTDFSILRNKGLEKAKNEWVLYVDADERISKELAHEIEQKTKVYIDINYYLLPRKNFYLGNHPWPKIEYMPRLFKKVALKGWMGKLHESPQVSGRQDVCVHFLLHFTHRNLSEMLEKTIIWSEIEAALRYKANHPRVTWWRFPRVMIPTFFTYYVSQKGYKAGTVGLIESIYQSFSIFITYARLWEMQQKQLKK